VLVETKVIVIIPSYAIDREAGSADIDSALDCFAKKRRPGGGEQLLLHLAGHADVCGATDLLFLGVAAVGNVECDSAHGVGLNAIVKRELGLEISTRPVSSGRRFLEFLRPARVNDGAISFGHALGLGGGEDLENCLTHYLIAPAMEVAFPAAVDEQITTLLVFDGHGDGSVVEDVLKPVLAGSVGVFCLVQAVENASLLDHLARTGGARQANVGSDQFVAVLRIGEEQNGHAGSNRIAPQLFAQGGCSCEPTIEENECGAACKVEDSAKARGDSDGEPYLLERENVRTPGGAVLRNTDNHRARGDGHGVVLVASS
jgi:hypothetical protein